MLLGVSWWWEEDEEGRCQPCRGTVTNVYCQFLNHLYIWIWLRAQHLGNFLELSVLMYLFSLSYSRSACTDKTSQLHKNILDIVVYMTVLRGVGVHMRTLAGEILNQICINPSKFKFRRTWKNRAKEHQLLLHFYFNPLPASSPSDFLLC